MSADLSLSMVRAYIKSVQLDAPNIGEVLDIILDRIEDLEETSRQLEESVKRLEKKHARSTSKRKRTRKRTRSHS